MSQMLFSTADLYPAMKATDTSGTSNPDRDDVEAFAEDGEEVMDSMQARTSTILVAGALMVALVVFFGIN